MKSKALEYFIQLLIVIIGVFLGTWATNWNSTRQQNKNQRQALQSILKEIESNQAKLHKAIAYHRKIFKSFDNVRKQLDYHDPQYKFNSKALKTFLPGWRGFGMPSLDNAMFEMAKYSNVIPGMPYQIQEVLSKVYRFQALYHQLSERVVNRLFDFNDQTPLANVMTVVWVMREGGFGSELNIRPHYKKAIELLRLELK